MDWWKDAETFHASTFANDWGQNGHFDWGTLAQNKFTFTTHCPIDKNFIERCHQMGVRCFPYLSFYFGAYNMQFGPIQSNTYEGVDFSQHPDFIERDQNQNAKPWVFSPTTPDGVGVTFLNLPGPPPPPTSPFLTCPNYAPYHERMLAWVHYIMQQGADGIYVDNLLLRSQCFANHAHIINPDSQNDPDTVQNQAFALLLNQARQVVKSYRPDGLVLGNSGDPLGRITGQSWAGFQYYLDSDTIEGYVCSGSRLANWQGKLSWSDFGQQLQPYLAQGKQILAISGFTVTNPTGWDSQLREDAFLCYCAARVAGLTWYGGPLERQEIADLHRVRLGSALAPAVTDSASQLSYRVFEQGVVAVNWSAAAQSFSYKNPVSPVAPTPPAPEFFYDLFTPSFTPIDLSATSGLISVPAQSGRVFLFGSSTDYGLNRLSPSISAVASISGAAAASVPAPSTQVLPSLSSSASRV